MDHFAVFDCSLARRAVGQSCSNLRELLTALRNVPDNVLEHHMLRCPLEDHFELYEFPNDLARWCWDALGDHVVGEQLGLVDPYRHPSHVGPACQTRGDYRKSAVDYRNVCRGAAPGSELHLWPACGGLRYGQHITTPVELAEAITEFARSLFFHVQKPTPHGRAVDDFSHWLAQYGRTHRWSTNCGTIDFYALNLSQFATGLMDVFGLHF